MIVRDFSNGGQFSVADWTQEVNVVPNRWGTIGRLGIFREEGIMSHRAYFEEIIQDGAAIPDRVRGERSNQNRDYQRKLHSFTVPHFPLDDAITPNDLRGKRAYGSPDGMETLDLVRARKLQRIRFNHAITLEVARAQAITQGTVYSPNGTVSMDWYQEMTGAARPAPIDFLFGTSTTDILGKIEVAVSAIQKNSGSVSLGSGVVALCSNLFFSRLISHATVKTAYSFYAATQNPLRDRLSQGTIQSMAPREFFFGGVTFIEMNDEFNGTPLIPVGEAYFLPTGTEYFKTYFSPADRFDLMDTVGEQVYVFETMNPNGTAYNIESESNHISALLKPLLVIRAVSTN